MFERFKKLKRIADSKVVQDAEVLEYNDDGSVQINVGLKTADDFFSPYSCKPYELMNNDVCDYINRCEAMVGVKEDISLEIYTETATSSDEKRRIRETVKRHHAEELVSINKRLARNLIEGVVFSLVGCGILFLEAVLYVKIKNLYLDTLLAVIGWLFLWDGLEVMISSISALRRKKLRSMRLLNAKVHIRKYSRSIQKEYKIGEFEPLE